MCAINTALLNELKALKMTLNRKLEMKNFQQKKQFHQDVDRIDLSKLIRIAVATKKIEFIWQT